MLKRAGAVGTALLLCVLVVGRVAAEGAKGWSAKGSGISSLRNMVIYVEDQYGTLTEGAEIVIRERSSYDIVGIVWTNSQGYAQIELDTETWYVVHVYSVDNGTREFWSYDYIQSTDWWSIYPYGIKMMRRDDPWIDHVSIPEADVELGQPLILAAELDHHLAQTNFDHWCRVMCYVDDDGQEPYVYQELSDSQVISDGFAPFAFDVMLDSAGEYTVRFVLEREFEGNEWEISDDTGWSWTATVAEQTVDIEGLVYLDMNGDGQHNQGEALGAGAVVEARDALGVFVGQAIADHTGRVRYEDLARGDYVLSIVELPPGLGRPRKAYAAHLDGADVATVQLALDPWRAVVPMMVAR